MRVLIRASVALALATCFAVPASARAATSVPASSCGQNQADFVGSFRIADAYDVLYAFGADKNLTVYYFGRPIGTGSFTAGDGAISWTVNASTTVSTGVACFSNGSAGNVSAIEGREEDGDTISLVRV